MTLKYLYGQDELVAEFVARMHHEPGYGKCSAIGVTDENGELIAGFVYRWFSVPGSHVMEMAIAALPGRQWLSRQTMAAMFQYPFLQCGAQMILIRPKPVLEKTLRMLAVLGFKFAAVERLYGRDEDAIFCTLTYERWMANKFNKQFKHHVVGTTDNRKAA